MWRVWTSTLRFTTAPKSSTAKLPVFCTYNLSSLDPQSHARMRFAARNLLRSQADLVCLQEISSAPGFLPIFQQTYLEGHFPYGLGPVGNDPRGMNLAVLSRYPILDWASHADDSFPLLDGSRSSRFSRDLLRLDWRCGSQVWRIFCTHLKSMRGGPAAHRQRESEAAAILAILTAQTDDRPWLLLGDLNDQPESPTLQRLLQSPLDLRNSLPPGKTTFPCRGSRHQFDYILYPGRMEISLVNSRVWPESRASDHAMVSATFDFP
ncbi:MAG: endonuclease/exonuclease/phosphatase family protein [Vulcanimicrobiota bacterium]